MKLARTGLAAALLVLSACSGGTEELPEAIAESTAPSTTAPPTTTTLAPYREEAPLDVPGYADRPTLLQMATDPGAPMLVVFHGQNGSIENIKERSDLPTLAESAGVTLLWLSGKPVPTRSWNTTGKCCEPAQSKGVEDMPYVEAALAAARAAGVTARTIVTTGVSNGGGMAVEVACRMPEVFAGAVSVAGWSPVSCSGRNVSLLAIGGTKDAKLGAARARSMTSTWRSGVVRCTGAPEKETKGIATVTTWNGCAEGRIVRLVELKGVPHVWPRFTDYDATVDMLAFAHDLDR